MRFYRGRPFKETAELEGGRIEEQQIPFLDLILRPRSGHSLGRSYWLEGILSLLSLKGEGPSLRPPYLSLDEVQREIMLTYDLKPSEEWDVDWNHGCVEFPLESVEEGGGHQAGLRTDAHHLAEGSIVVNCIDSGCAS